MVVWRAFLSFIEYGVDISIFEYDYIKYDVKSYTF